MVDIDERRIDTRHPVDIFNIRGVIQPVGEFSDIITPVGSPLDFHMIDFSSGRLSITGLRAGQSR